MCDRPPEQKRVAVLGARGMLGTDLVEALRAHHFAPTAYDLPEFDICNQAHLEDALQGVDAVVNCAAFTNVDGAETSRDLASAVNGAAVGQLGQAALQRDLHVIHIGTDFVFDGRLDRPYTESDEPRPLSVYGETKLAGETLLAESGCRHAIVRVQWTYGKAGHHFVSKLLARAETSNELKMVQDQVGSPTWTCDVATALVDLIELGATGLFHYAADGYATRYQVAEFLLSETGLGRNLIPCRTSDFPAAAVRPLNSRFDCRKIDAILRHRRPHWQDSLRRFLQSTI